MEAHLCFLGCKLSKLTEEELSIRGVRQPRHLLSFPLDGASRSPRDGGSEPGYSWAGPLPAGRSGSTGPRGTSTSNAASLVMVTEATLCGYIFHKCGKHKTPKSDLDHFSLSD